MLKGIDLEKFRVLSFDVIIVSTVYFTFNLIKKCLLAWQRLFNKHIYNLSCESWFKYKSTTWKLAYTVRILIQTIYARYNRD